ncbi:HPr family phosphocarrier protein [Glycomyces luteolus]|uniref:HPr family phosphocarrier protein n=1 Tax=Glycomyces luteolus TaxID=2670330 RepID=A0A9X3SQF7_9ACTN|nr:HPr family phosphocarrier protein [Glycomyces luteolus]MDA1360071.1 HPr family phosphocarrier protein [Glycomyces luteolus]
MSERRVVIASTVGLHARPAKLFAKLAGDLPAKVTIAKEGQEPVDARSLLMILTLDAKGGDEVVLAAEGEGAEESLDALAAELQTDRDAP